MHKRLLLLGCLFVLGLQAVVQIRLASLDSATTDEAVHLAAGYTYLTRGDFRFNPEHPPLPKVLAALPLLALKPDINAEAEALWKRTEGKFFYDNWRENRAFGEEMLYNSGNNPDELLLWTRLPMILLTFLLGLTILLIAWRHWGAAAALIATTLYALNPTVNGHGHLITTDIALALGFVLAVYTFWQFLTHPVWSRAVWFGLAFGFALLTKHTAILLLPVFLILAVIAWRDRGRQSHWKATLGRLASALLIVWVMIWIGFGFTDQTLPATSSISNQVERENLIATKLQGAEFSHTSIVNEEQFQLTGEELSSIRSEISAFDHVYSFLQPVLTVLPGHYLKGLFLVVGHASGGHDSFLLGETSKQGWWYYFPILFLFKTPIAALIIVAGGVYLTVRNWRSSKLVQALAIGGGVFLIFALLSKANLGLRHILPTFPFLFLLAGYATTLSVKFKRVALIALVWLALVFAANFPYYLGYFNELSGGPKNAYRIATDSNLDWGQDLRRIARFVERRGIENLYIEYNWLGTYALDYYLGAESYTQLRTYEEGQPGYAIINVSALYQPDFSFIENCDDQEFITPGVIGCELGNDQ